MNMDDDVADGTSQAAESDPLLDDTELVQGAPIRPSEWLRGPIFFGGGGIAGIAIIVWLAGRTQLHLVAWMLGGIAVLLLPFAAILARVGHRAYVLLTPESVRTLIVVRTVGLWAFSAALLVTGTVSGVWFVTLMAFSMTQSLYFAYRSRKTRGPNDMARLARRFRPVLIAECVFAIAGPPVAALIAWQVGFTDKHGSQYIADAIVVPIYVVVAVVLILRRRRRARA